MNLKISCVFFSANTPQAVKEELGNILGIHMVSGRTWEFLLLGVVQNIEI